MALILLLAATLAGLTGVSHSDTNKWINAGLGFDILKAECDAHGIWVKFRTDAPPPYLVAVYDPAHLGLDRIYPLDYVITEQSTVYLPTRPFLTAHVFLQVGELMAMTKGRKIQKVGWSRMKDGPVEPGSEILNWNNPSEFAFVGDYTYATFLPGDWTGYQLRITSPDPHYDYYYKDQVFYSLWRWDETYTENISTGALTDYNLVETLLTTNGTEYGFHGDSHLISKKSTDNGDGTRHVVVQSVIAHPTSTNRVVASRIVQDYEALWCTIPTMDCSVGTGYRIVKFADHDKQFITRAYSRRPDRSDEYLIRKPTKALSVWDGRSIKFDWLGRPYYSDNTNAVPGRLYMNGVPW